MNRKEKKVSRSLTGLEVLGIAIRSEVEAHRFYTQVLKRVQNPILREKLSRLAAEEKRHRQILEERYRKSTGEVFPPLPTRGGAGRQRAHPPKLNSSRSPANGH